MSNPFDTGILKNSQIKYNEPLSRHISFRLGGEAKRFILLDIADAPALLKELAASGEKYAFLGNGTNVLVRDGGFDGTVIKLKSGEVQVNGGRLSVSAGTTLAQLAQTACEHSLTGLEFAHGIPGTVGGAVMMNAGAYGGEIKDVLVNTVYCTPEGEVRTLTQKEHRFGYRTSFFKEHPEYLILSAEFEPKRGESSEIKNAMAELARRRRESQPLDKPSAGSTFKRPEGYFAGKLIEDSGLKGFTIGGAQVSQKHAGFVINAGNATCRDVLALCSHIQKTVYDRFGVTLEREIKILGEE
ncbi:MAG: UDP-N-acetylmuramate dehydrogenase [Clostridia bacterium]|nr:UDP-N-acetylmuramate dehydrogenase [Clostridia bacterium]